MATSGELWSSFTLDPRDRANAGIRASDADREVVHGVLSDAFGDGRLDHDELDERMAAAAAVRVLGQIPPLVLDLVPLRPPPDPSTRWLVGVPHADLVARAEREWVTRRRAAVFTFLGTAVICWAVWAAVLLGSGGEADFPWPLIVNAVMLLNLGRVVLGREEIVAAEVRRLEKRKLRQERWPRALPPPPWIP